VKTESVSFDPEEKDDGENAAFEMPSSGAVFRFTAVTLAELAVAKLAAETVTLI
jgi:hypothetical protein